MRCTKCGTESTGAKKFCAECGAALSARCPKCGADNAPVAKFCGDCGAALAASAASAPAKSSNASPIRVAETPAPENLDGERKTVTALFADIKGSTALMESLDPEAAHALVAPVLRLMIEAVHRYEGYVVRTAGDGIFALFGAPVAHEDHPQRALYAALRLQEELKRHATRLREAGELPIEARVGVNTGEVVAYSVETDGKVEYRLVGHTANLAARMEALAPTGSIAISEDTRKLAEGYFALKALGPTIVKGVSEPVNVYEVTGLGPLRTRLQRAAGRGLTKFVGREREMEALKHAAEQAKSGRGQIAAAMAEPGVGKSRLYFEFKAIEQSGWMVLETFSVSHGRASAYLPLIDLLHAYFEISSEDDGRRRREKVAGRIAMLDRALEDALPYLFALLGIVEGDDPLAQMDGQVKKRRTLEVIKRILLRESLNHPLMVIFEDLHWIDEATQEFLNLLADSIGTAKILLLVNYRPEYAHQWGSKTYYTQLRLDPLGRESAEAMLSALLGDSAELAPLKRLIIERTEGTPFFMEETVQVLLDEGALARNGGALTLTRPLSELKIPPTVQAILAARIDRLAPAAKELLQTLAVIGREFPLSLIRRVISKSDGELERLLADLQLGEFIYEQPAMGDTEYVFKHALTQDVADTSVLIERRKLLHERIGAALESLYATSLDDHLAELAHHYIRGDNPEKALHYAGRAAQQDFERAAYREANSAIEAGLALLSKIPEGDDRSRAELSLRAIQPTLAFVLHGSSSRQREEAIVRISDLSERVGELDSLLRSLIYVIQLRFTQGEALRGRELVGRCLELAAKTNDPGMLTDSFYGAAVMAESCGNLVEAAAHFEQAILLSGTLTQIGLWGVMPRSSLPGQMASAEQLLGRPQQAETLAAEGLAHARESKHLFTLGMVLADTGWMGRYRRTPEVVLSHAEEQIALALENGFAEWLPWGRFHRGWALAELSKLDEGIAEMEAGIAGFRALGGVPRMQYAIASLAWHYAFNSRLDEALTMLDAALAHVERSGEKVELAEMLRLKGEILLLRNRSATADAQRCFREAIAVARRQEARWWELRATTSLARLLASQGNRNEARTMLAAIYGWFTEGFELPDLRDAAGLLDQLKES